MTENENTEPQQDHVIPGRFSFQTVASFLRRESVPTVFGLLLIPILILCANGEPPKPREKINLLLVGRTGSGKSTSGNLILGKDIFKAGISPNSITKHFQLDSAIVLGRNVTVVDGPGLGDTKMTDEESVKMVIAEGEKALAACPEGFDAILITIPLGRYTEQDKQIFLQLKAIFGESYIRDAGTILVTHGDDYKPHENEGKSFEEWYPEQTGLFQEFLTECNGRVVLFGKNVHAKELEILFEVIRNKHNYKRRYYKRHFNAALGSRKALLVTIRERELRENVSEKITRILHQLSNGSVEDLNEEKIRLQKLMSDTSRLLYKVKVEDDGTGVLRKLMDMVQKAEATVSASLTRVDLALKHAEDLKKMEEILKNQKFKNEEERNKMEERMRVTQELLRTQVELMETSKNEIRRELQKEERKSGGFFASVGRVIDSFFGMQCVDRMKGLIAKH